MLLGNGVLGVPGLEAGPEVLSHNSPDGVDGAVSAVVAGPAAGELGVTGVPGLALPVVVGTVVDGVVVDALGLVVDGGADDTLGDVVVAGAGEVVGVGVGVGVGVVESAGSGDSGVVEPSTTTGGAGSVAGASGWDVQELAGALGTANSVVGGEAGATVALASRFSTLVLSWLTSSSRPCRRPPSLTDCRLLLTSASCVCA